VLKKLWYERPVRTQLLIAVGIINLVAALVASANSILNARAATKVEIEASLEVAERLVVATMKDLLAKGGLAQLRQELPLRLKNLRHVRILFMGADNHLAMVSPHTEGEYAPRWFAALVRPDFSGHAVKVVALHGVDPVIILGEPEDEIGEAWEYFSLLAIVLLVLNVLVLAVLYVVLGRLLGPLVHLSKGMQSLEDGHYATRLTLPKVKELAVLAERFNTLASELGNARDENSRLYRQLITVQEEERREIANELHDEAGPCLFGITANASSIQKLADQKPDSRTTEISRRVGEILSITERLKLLNRALLKKLRPVPFGRVKLVELLDELVTGFQRRHPDVQIAASFGKLANHYGETIDVTLYRCVQEGITNAIQHGKARALTVDVSEIPAPQRNRSRTNHATVTLDLRDDGTGIARATPKGFGLTTMTERVRSLGGSCVIDSAPAKGTAIHVEIPMERKKARARKAEMV